MKREIGHDVGGTIVALRLEPTSDDPLEWDWDYVINDGVTTAGRESRVKVEMLSGTHVPLGITGVEAEIVTPDSIRSGGVSSRAMEAYGPELIEAFGPGHEALSGARPNWYDGKQINTSFMTGLVDGLAGEAGPRLGTHEPDMDDASHFGWIIGEATRQAFESPEESHIGALDVELDGHLALMRTIAHSMITVITKDGDHSDCDHD